jgi:hypothetical protein
MALRRPLEKLEGVGRQLDPGDRVGLAKDDTIEVQIEVHLVPHGQPYRLRPRYDAPPCRGDGSGCG